MTTHATAAKSEAFTVVWIALSGTHTVKSEMQTTLILNTRQKTTTLGTSSIELNGVGGGFAGEGIKDKTRQARWGAFVDTIALGASSKPVSAFLVCWQYNYYPMQNAPESTVKRL